MINGAYYHTIYLIILSFLSIFCINKYRFSIRKSRGSINALIYAIFLTVFIGFRPYMDVLTDTIGISQYYKSNMGYVHDFSMDVENKLYDNMLLYFASLNLDFSIFLVAMSGIYFICRYIALKKMFPNHVWAAYLLFLASFISYTSSVNGFKAGAAASLFCIAIAYRKNIILSLCFLLLSYGMHHSMIVCVTAFVCVSFYKNTKIYLIAWFSSFILAVLHIKYFQFLFGSFTDQKGADYLLTEHGAWMTGMRYDFVLYSFMPIILALYILFKKKIIIDENYKFVLNLYMVTNSIWLLCMYANYTNRIAALSWFMYSIVIGYPFLSDGNIYQFVNKNRTFSMVMALHLGFTLFMS